MSSAQQIKVSTFVRALKRSELVEPKRLERALRDAALTTSSESRKSADVANQLINAGVITKWQAKRLLKGKHRGFQLGKYVLRRPIGQGGMGVVYEAEHSVLNNRVAIKILPADKDTERATSRFLAEARAAAKLDHRNIVRVHDCDTEDDRMYMVMELIKGSNLGDLVAKQGPLPFRTAIQYLAQAAAGLKYAHDHGITHRDVKPQNFLINQQHVLKVADLGLALFDIDTPDRHTRSGDESILGTVDYVAPEQAWDSRKVDRRADIYSLGCTLYFMLTGTAPFSKGTVAQRLAKHQNTPPRPITELRPDCPPKLWALCQRMLAKKPNERPQKMGDVISACKRIFEDLPKTSSAGLINFDFDHVMTGVDSKSSSSLRISDSQGSISTLTDLASALSDTQISAAGALSSSNFYQPAAQPAPAESKQKKKTQPIQSSIGLRIAAYTGLAAVLVAFSSVIFVALNDDADHPDSDPTIKKTETGGPQVIIVKQNK